MGGKARRQPTVKRWVTRAGSTAHIWCGRRRPVWDAFRGWTGGLGGVVSVPVDQLGLMGIAVPPGEPVLVEFSARLAPDRTLASDERSWS